VHTARQPYRTDLEGEIVKMSNSQRRSTGLLFGVALLVAFAGAAHAQPVINSISPTQQLVFSPVTINGSGFGAVRGTSRVTFHVGTKRVELEPGACDPLLGNPLMCQIIEQRVDATEFLQWSDTQLRVNVPGDARTGGVLVLTGAGTSNRVSVTVLPTITLWPAQARIFDEIALIGRFGPTQGTVTFSGGRAPGGCDPIFDPTCECDLGGCFPREQRLPAQIVSWTNTSVVVRVPERAVNGAIVVNVGGLNSNRAGINILPTIFAVSPNPAGEGTTIEIDGWKFGNPVISFGGVETGPLTVTSSRISVVVPPGAATGNLTFRENGLVSNAVPFTVIPVPRLTSLSVTSGAPNTLVTLVGSNFGPDASASSVVFTPQLAAQVVSWSDTRVEVLVPELAEDGPVVLKKHNVTSNALPFDVTDADPAAAAITPLLRCVHPKDKDTFYAVFGYRNTGEDSVAYMPETGKNTMRGSVPTYMGQPLVVHPGEQTAVVAVPFPADGEVTWALGNGTVGARASSPPCVDAQRNNLCEGMGGETGWAFDKGHTLTNRCTPFSQLRFHGALEDARTTLIKSRPTINGASTFVVGVNGRLMERRNVGGTWQWLDHGAPNGTTVVSAPAAVPSPAGVDVFVRGNNGKLYALVNSHGFLIWRDLGYPGVGLRRVPLASAPVPAVWRSQAGASLVTSVFVKTTDGRLWENVFRVGSQITAGWQDHGSSTDDLKRAGLDLAPPSVLVYTPPGGNGRQVLYVFTASRLGHVSELRLDGGTPTWTDYHAMFNALFALKRAENAGIGLPALSNPWNDWLQRQTTGVAPVAFVDRINNQEWLRVFIADDGDLLEFRLPPDPRSRFFGHNGNLPDAGFRGNVTVHHHETKKPGFKVTIQNGVFTKTSTPVKLGGSVVLIPNPSGGASIFGRAGDGGLLEFQMPANEWEYHEMPASLPNCRRAFPGDGSSMMLDSSEASGRFRYYQLATTPSFEWQGGTLVMFGSRVNGRLIEGIRGGATGKFDWKDRHCAGPNVTWDDFAKVSGCGNDLEVNIIFPQWVTTRKHDEIQDLTAGLPSADTPRIFAGTVVYSSATHEDNPMDHGRGPGVPEMLHDWNIFVAPDLQHQHMLGNANFAREDGREGSLEVEWEQAPDQLSLDGVPGVGEQVWMKGRWIQDCGHSNKTEIHAPNALVTVRPAVSAASGIAGTQAVMRIGRKGGPLFYTGDADCKPFDELIATAKREWGKISWWKPWTWGPIVNGYLFIDDCKRHTPVDSINNLLHPDKMCYSPYNKDPGDDLGALHPDRVGGMQKAVPVEFDIPLPPQPPGTTPRMGNGIFTSARFFPAEVGRPARFHVLVDEATVRSQLANAEARTLLYHAFWEGSTVPSGKRLAVCATYVPRRHHEPGNFIRPWCDDDTTDEVVAFVSANGSFMRMTPNVKSCTTVALSASETETLTIRSHGYESDMSNSERWDDNITIPAPDDMIGLTASTFEFPNFGLSTQTYKVRSYASTRTPRSREWSHEDYELHFTIDTQPRDPEPLPIFFEHEVSLDVTPAAETVPAGGEARYTVTLTNTGALTAEGVVAEGTLAGDAAFQSCDIPGGTCDFAPGRIRLAAPTLAGGASVAATVVARSGCNAAHGYPIIHRVAITEGAASDIASADVTILSTFAVDPTEKAFGSDGGAGTVNVAGMSTTCSWKASSASEWVTITSGAEGTGSGAVAYTVAANTTDYDRTGMLAVAGRNVVITQSARAPRLDSVSPTAGAIGATLTLRGAAFRASGEVRLGEALLTVVSWTDTEVRARIPQGVAEGATNLRVFARGSGALIPSNPVAFTVTRACVPIFGIDGTRDNYLEAEFTSANAGTRFTDGSDSARSGGAYKLTAQGAGNFSTAGTSPDHLVYELNVTSGGTFNVWLLASGPDTSSDSFWVNADTGTDVSVNNIPSAWTWVKSPSTVSLATGRHTLRLKLREDGARVDKVLVTKLNTTPSGLGGGALGGCGRPSAPTGLTATPGNTRVTLTWTASTGAVSYNVKRSATSGGPYMLAAPVAASAGTRYVDEDLTNGTTYYYVVTAASATDESGPSAQVSARPEPMLLPPSALVAVAVSPARVDLMWVDNATRETGYAVERATVVNTTTGTFTRIATLPVDTRSYSDTTALANTTYAYRVQATAAVPSAFSNEARVTTPIASITSLAPPSGAVGTTVTITGANFGPTQGGSSVRFGGVVASPSSWSATSIVTTVPSGATSGPVTVTVGGVASNGVAFTVPAAAPQITSLSPTSGPVATAVTISGSGFGATQGASTVRFNGTSAAVTSWSSTSIVATVSAGATTGPVTVTVGGLTSNGVTFTVTSCTAGILVNGSVDAYIEAEDYTNTTDSGFQGVNDATRSAGSYMHVPNGVGNFTTAGTSPHHLLYTLNVSNGGTFNIWLLASGPDTSSDSFWVNVDGGTDVSVNNIPAAWTWMKSPTTVSLTNGTHVLRIKAREDAARVDKVLLTKQTTTPTGLGNTATPACRPRITSVTPVTGGTGTLVMILGTGFGSTQGTSTVTFGGTPITGGNWTDTRIDAPVPAGAVTGTVLVVVNQVRSNGVFFTVPAGPVINSLSPSSGGIGSSVSILGQNFGSSQGASTVRFSGVLAAVSGWTATQINTTVPSGATSGNVVVTVGGAASNGVPFTVSAPPPPRVTGLLPGYGAVGSLVTISGTDFGAAQGNSLVRFNGVLAAPTSWSNTQIVVPVPNGASSGPVLVWVGTQGNMDKVFTVTTTPTCPAYTIDGNVAASYIEAEAFSARSGHFGQFFRFQDLSASREALMYNGIGNYPLPGTSEDQLIYNLNVTNGGTFTLWLLTSAFADTAPHTFWVAVDDAPDQRFDLFGTGVAWTRHLTTLNLPSGAHRLKISSRDPNTKVDKFVLTKNSQFVPMVPGGTALSTCAPPPAPTGLAATGQSGRQVCLSWTGSSAAMSYSVHWGTASRQYFIDSIDEPNLSRCYQVELSGVRYFFGVKAYNAGGVSGLSNEASAIAGP
jgi:uncharacterized repeat protein (TIGR01451 family)